MPVTKRRKMSKSIRKYIRKEKSRIRREVLDIKQQEEQIQQLLSRYYKSVNNTGTKNESK